MISFVPNFGWLIVATLVLLAMVSISQEPRPVVIRCLLSVLASIILALLWQVNLPLMPAFIQQSEYSALLVYGVMALGMLGQLLWVIFAFSPPAALSHEDD